MAYSFDSWLKKKPRAPGGDEYGSTENKADLATGGLSGLSAPGGVAGVAAKAPPPGTVGDVGTGGKWVNFDRLVAANQGDAKGMADRAVGEVQKHGDAAKNMSAALATDQKELMRSGVAGGSAYADNTPGYQEAKKEAHAAAQGAEQLASQGGREAYLKKTYAENEAGDSRVYTPGMSRQDAALMDSQGQGRWEGAKRRWGGIEAQLGRDQTAALGETNARNTTIAAEAAAKEKDRQARAAQEHADFIARSNAYNAQNKVGVTSPDKKRSWEDYTDTDAEDVVHDIGRALDPVSTMSDIFGVRSPLDAATAGMEGMVNKEGGNLHSTNVKFEDTAMDREVYESMTDEELTALEKMSRNDQRDWIERRWAELHKDDAAMVALKKKWGLT